MTYNNLISVIIPCYNASQYLNDIASDLRNQSYRDFEAIFVNDGDDSQNSILEDIRKQDTRFKIFYSHHNGVSSARNLGLQKANGDWIAFIDADDRISVDYLSHLIKNVDGSDIVIGGFSYFNPNTNISTSKFIDERYCKSCSSIQSIFDYLEEHVEYRSVWAKIYNSKIIKDNDIKFNVNYNVAEDWLFNLLYYVHVTTVTTIADSGYKYVYGNDNSSICSYDTKHIEVRMIGMELASKIREINGWPKSIIDEKKQIGYTDLCFSFMKNLFCTKGHPGLFESCYLIKSKLISNNMLIYSLSETKVSKLSEKAQRLIILTKCPILISVLHKILYTINNIKY